MRKSVSSGKVSILECTCVCLLTGPWLKTMYEKSEGRLNTPFIIIHAIFRRLIIKLARKHSRLGFETKNINIHASGRGLLSAAHLFE